MNLLGNVGVFLKVNNLNPRLLPRKCQSRGNSVDSDDARRAFEECPTSDALTNRSEAPDTDRVALLDASIDDGMI